MIVADFSIVPMGTGTSASRYIRAVYEMLEEMGARYMPGPMSTALETDNLTQLFEIIEHANEMLAGMGVGRMITTVRIDYRLDKDISMDSKLRATRAQGIR